jgi:bloom syndrome protein
MAGTLDQWFGRGAGAGPSRAGAVPADGDALSLAARELFGHASFRHNQRAVIEASLARRDIFVLMPTGGGKSLCYQLPALLSPGLTVIVSPLLALIQDQVTALLLAPCGGVPTSFLSSDASDGHTNGVYAELARRPMALKLLYVTPETLLQSTRLGNALDALHGSGLLARIVVDEAHCIATWGADFRPNYQLLGQVRQTWRDVPLAALTATAPQRVCEQIVQQLRLVQPLTFRTSFNRRNLIYSVHKQRRLAQPAAPQPPAAPPQPGGGSGGGAASAPAGGKEPKECKESKEDVLVRLLEAEDAQAAGIIYCLSRDDCERVCHYLKGLDFSATFFHAGMPKGSKQRVQSAWQSGEVRIVCATIAMGMGIDKADVRFVIHHSMPKSIEGYYQESGRAGRDGREARCALIWAPQDFTRTLRLIQAPQKGRTRAVVQHNISLATDMRQYCEEPCGCRRAILLDYLGEDKPYAPCERTCDNCARGNVPQTDVLVADDAGAARAPRRAPREPRAPRAPRARADAAADDDGAARRPAKAARAGPSSLQQPEQVFLSAQRPVGLAASSHGARACAAAGGVLPPRASWPGAGGARGGAVIDLS